MKWLVAVAIVFFLLIIDILIGLSIYYLIRSQHAEQTKPDYSNKTGETKPDYSNMTATDQPKPEFSNIMVTGQTKPDKAALMVKKMNRSVDPCVDFNEYACGRFNREQAIMPGQTQVTAITIVRDQNQQVMRDIISGEVTSEQPRYLQNMKRYYKSCMDIAQIEKTGLAAFHKEPYSKDWPTVNIYWNSTTFDLNDAIARYAVVDIWPIFGVQGRLDYKNSSKKILANSWSTAGLGLPKEYYKLPRNDSRLLAYQRVYIDIAEELGISMFAEPDAVKVVDLEIALSKIMASSAERQDVKRIYNPVKMSQLATMYPLFNVSRAIRTLFATRNITIPDDETVMNMFPAYMTNLNSVLTRFNSRDIQNLFGFSFALKRVQDMSKRMREIWLDLDKVFLGKTEETPRWQYCLSITSKGFSKGMSKQFVARTFSEQAKTYMEEMIDNLKKSFREIIEESTWMDPSTKEAAYKKLAVMTFKIGYPNTGFTNEDIEREYEHYVMLEDNYYSNRELVTRLDYLDSLPLLRKPVDRNEWSMAAHEVNAYYTRTDNAIVFPAGILQIPLYSQTFQDYLSYGGIGSVIGHEITHGFDYKGSQFDGDGNFVNWWQKSDREVFLNKSQCIQDQCSSFRLDEVNMTLNGINMFDESIADNGGLKESFRAYKKLVSRKGENPVLPNLGLTQDQLFFLAFAQLWCEKITRESLINQLTSEDHPPGKFRIIGTLQNSEDFAKAYNCPSGSYMNPVKKCVVW